VIGGGDPSLLELARRRWWILIAGLAVYLVAVEPFWGRTADDAYISLRYAQSWAAGCGPVYSCGEAPVEGYTNFLWVAVAAGAMKVGLDAVVAMRIVGLLCGFLALAAAVLLGLRISGRWPAALLPLAALAASPFWAVNAVNGLETPAAALTVLWAALASLGLPRGRRPWLAGAAWGVSYLLRPEGVAFAALTGLWGIVAGLAQRAGLRRVARTALLFGAGFVVVAAPYFLWRLSFYGDLLPNSFHAKNLPSDLVVPRNLRHLAQDWLYFGPLLLGALATLIAVRRWSHLYLFLLALTSVAISVSVHNNFWMAGHRLYMTAAALLCVVAAGLAELGSGWRRWFGYASVVLAASVVLLGNREAFAPTWKLAHKHYATDDNPARALGLLIRRMARPGDWLAIRDAGMVPFFAGPKLKVLDMHERSLNDRQITRHGWSEDYIMSRAPRFIVFASPFPKLSPLDSPLCQLQGIPVLRWGGGTERRCLIFAHLQGWLVGRSPQFRAAGYRHMTSATWHVQRHFHLFVRDE